MVFKVTFHHTIFLMFFIGDRLNVDNFTHLSFYISLLFPYLLILVTKQAEFYQPMLQYIVEGVTALILGGCQLLSLGAHYS